MHEPETGGIVLQAERVSRRYGQVLALDSVSMGVRRAECVALIGESGSGKTTLLRCFNRLVDPDQGRVLVDGADAAGLLTCHPARGMTQELSGSESGVSATQKGRQVGTKGL